MNEAKEEWMPEIYIASLHPLPARTRGLTWKREEDGMIESVSRERKFARERKFGPGRRREWWEDSSEKERAKLQSLNMLSLYLPLYAGFDGESACDRKLVKSGGQRVRRAIRSRIYKEWRRDLCRAVGYLSVSMAHAISLHGYRYILSTSESKYRFPSLSFFSSSLSFSFRIYSTLLSDVSLPLFFSIF